MRPMGLLLRAKWLLQTKPGWPGARPCTIKGSACPGSTVRQPGQVGLERTGIDPAGGNRLAVRVADPAAVDVGQTGREDQQLAALGLLVVAPVSYTHLTLPTN